MMDAVPGITTHVLDTSAGAPAAGVPVALEVRGATGWEPVGAGVTDGGGRVSDLISGGANQGTYRIRFDTATYFGALGVRGFYPEVTVVFEVRDAGEHHHVPLLLSPFGYSTYRGS
jgi:5-hydroxyisourate hydrolase